MSEKKHHSEESHRNHGKGEHDHKNAHAHKADHLGDSPADKTADVDPVSAIKTERDDLLNRLQRLSADFCNYQKRAARDVDQARQFASEEIIKALVPVLDDMDLAIEAGLKTKQDQNDPLVAGMKLVHDKMIEILSRFGLTIVDQPGQFDPEIHNALMQEPCADCPPMTILKILQKGYQLKGRTIRPAAVIVSQKADTPPQQAEENKESK